MQWTYHEIRRRLIEAGLWPEGRMARIACYLAGLAAVLFVLQKLLGWLAPAWGEHLGGWVGISRLHRRHPVLHSRLPLGEEKNPVAAPQPPHRHLHFHWRDSCRAGASRWQLSPSLDSPGNLPCFVVNSEIHAELRSLEAANAAIANELAAHLENGDKPIAESLAGLRNAIRPGNAARFALGTDDKELSLGDDAQADSVAMPRFVKGSFRDIVRDRDQLYLRVVSTVPLKFGQLDRRHQRTFRQGTASATLPRLWARSRFTCQIVWMSLPAKPDEKSGSSSDGLHASASTRPPQRNQSDRHQITMAAGSRPFSEPTSRSALCPKPRTAGTMKFVWLASDGGRLENRGERAQGWLLHVRTRPSVLYGRSVCGTGRFCQGCGVHPAGHCGIFFAIIELIALFTGTRMTRTVTRRSPSSMTPPRTSIAAISAIASRSSPTINWPNSRCSFNSMTESIEKLILEQKEKQRLENELAIAQEVQAQLFPRQVTELESLEVHGFCRPARTVSGDYYDFLTASSNKLILAVGDISGKGISAALLMATIHSAVRAYSVESLPQMREPVAVGAVAGAGRVMATWPEGVEVSPGALLGLLNHQLYESTPPEKYATLFLGIYDGRSHRLTYSNGGHLPPILIGEDGAIRRLEGGGTVVGLFDNMTYDEGRVEMHPGEIFVAYSDGVTEPENDFGEFGEQRLIDLVRDNRHLPFAQISQTVTTAVDDWIGDKEQPDDVTLVLARAR